MAASDGRETPSVEALLLQEPHRFDFFQAVRLLEQLRREADATSEGSPDPQVGQDTSPADEAVRFHTCVSAGFPAAAVQTLVAPTGDGADRRPMTMTVNFMGLTGPNGVLPSHFTMLLIQQQRANNPRLAAFHDIFNHRLVSLFYRAWEKCHFPVAYDRCLRAERSTAEDLLTRCLLSLAGFGFDSLLGRLAFRDEALTFYAGHLAQSPRNAVALAALLADFLRMPIEIQQFSGQWYTFPTDEQSRMPSSIEPTGRNAQVGSGLIIGERVFLVDRRFRVLVGPLTLDEYLRLLPFGDGHDSLQDWIRCYCGPEFDFEIELTLEAPEVPPCRLGASGSRLGWTAFVGSQSFVYDVSGAKLSCRDRN